MDTVKRDKIIKDYIDSLPEPGPGMKKMAQTSAEYYRRMYGTAQDATEAVGQVPQLAQTTSPDDRMYLELQEAAKDHPPTMECPDPECLVCGVRDCPLGEPLHYHHDGCPACTEAERQQSTKDPTNG